MTIPMLPGPWDEVKDSVQQLGLTVARSLDPQFDAKIALGQIMRDPSKIQGMIDLAHLNPQAISSVYGTEALRGLQGMGQASTGANIEQAGRGMMNQNPATVADTGATRAAGSALGIPTASGVRAEGQAETLRTQQIESNAMNLDMARLENAAKAPGLQARIAAIRAQPGMAMANPYQMAVRIARGEIDETDSEMLESMRNLSPAGFEEFQRYLSELMANSRSEAVDRRQGAREQTGFRRWAADRGTETGIPAQAWLDYIEGKDTPGSKVAELWTRENKAEQDRIARMREIGRISTEIQQLGRTANFSAAAKAAKAQLVEQELASAFGIPIQIVREGWFSPRMKFKLPDGREITSDDLTNLSTMDDFARTVYVSTVEQLQQGLAALEANKATTDASSYERQKLAIEAEIARRGSTRSTRNPQRGPRAQTR